MGSSLLFSNSERISISSSDGEVSILKQSKAVRTLLAEDAANVLKRPDLQYFLQIKKALLSAEE